MTSDPRQSLLRIYHAALAAVHGQRCVANELVRYPLRGPIHLVAIGKAAAAMTEGALAVVGDQIVAGLVVTKHGHLTPALAVRPQLRLLEADHPLPGPASLAAGEALLRFLAAAPNTARFLFLVSGGTSSLVEVLPPELDLATYRRVNDWLLASGLDIGAMNRVRKRLSLIKGGRLLRYLHGRPARNLLISDVPGDDPGSIGSGLLVPQHTAAEMPPVPDWLAELVATDGTADVESTFSDVEVKVIAGNRHALAAAVAAAGEMGLVARRQPRTLDGDATAAGWACAARLLEGEPGVYLWGGETTVRLPPNPGRGGRNQSLALAAALELAGHTGVYLLAAGTDGTDGPTEDAGALVDGGTLARGETEGLDAAGALAAADAGRFLEAAGDLVQTGPTGTNVMDLVIALKRPG